jgi:hypothetical protein
MLSRDVTLTLWERLSSRDYRAQTPPMACFRMHGAERRKQTSRRFDGLEDADLEELLEMNIRGGVSTA